MDANFDEAQMARAMIGRSRNVVVVADATKFDRRAAFQVCALSDVDLHRLRHAAGRRAGQLFAGSGGDNPMSSSHTEISCPFSEQDQMQACQQR